MKMDKSLVTNLVSLLISVIGLLMVGRAGDVVMNIGLYALSGAFTNWLAIYMLFEKVPGFYGSGVIPARFNEFKTGIREMVMQQFFNPDNIRQFFSQGSSGQDSAVTALIEDLVARVDFNKAFDALVEVILQSSFGRMLGMVGGAKALQSLREPFVGRMQVFLEDMARDEELLAQVASHSSAMLLDRVEVIVDRRLDELTPQQVKRIIEKMIHEHLGWLVVWGGVVGGLIGVPAAFLA